ncbi:6-bladed beta-propeller, partial [candidate division KSB1 bacterium]
MKTLRLIAVLLFTFLNCSKQSDNNTFRQKNPVLLSEDCIQFEKETSIDISKLEKYYITMIKNIAIDSEDNIYICAPMENKIFVFNSNGEFLKSLGGLGQGPKELLKPVNISIINNQIHIYESRRGIKIWDLNGNYIDYKLLKKKLSNPLFIGYKDYIIGNYYTYSIRAIEEAKNTKLKFSLSVFNRDFEEMNEITSFSTKSGENRWYAPLEFIALD